MVWAEIFSVCGIYPAIIEIRCLYAVWFLVGCFYRDVTSNPEATAKEFESILFYSSYPRFHFSSFSFRYKMKIKGEG
jgi:hypothetical protein